MSDRNISGIYSKILWLRNHTNGSQILIEWIPKSPSPNSQWHSKFTKHKENYFKGKTGKERDFSLSCVKIVYPYKFYKSIWPHRYIATGLPGTLVGACASEGRWSWSVISFRVNPLLCVGYTTGTGLSVEPKVVSWRMHNTHKGTASFPGQRPPKAMKSIWMSAAT